jgi:signal transduction histidine kinase
MFSSLLKYRKPGFGYLYTSFGISLIILLVLSLLFYRRLDLLVQYSDDADHAYEVILNLKKLENHVKDVETSGRGYMLSRDSSFLEQREEFKHAVILSIDSLRTLLKNDTGLSIRLSKINQTIRRRINLQDLNIRKVALNDSTGLAGSLNEGEYYMNQFRYESQALEKEGIIKSVELNRSKKFYEDITPNFFSIVLIFSGIITLISFIYLVREMKIRLTYQKELEKKLQELNRSYAELEQFTFVTSHDLQEPLRKIRTFSDRLMLQHREQMDEKGLLIIERINVAAKRLQELIQDVNNFTTLINKDERSLPIDLNWIVGKNLNEFASTIEQQKINIITDRLPVITGYPDQLLLLFRSLIDNAIKFSNKDEYRVIKVKYLGIERHHRDGSSLPDPGSYHKICIEDNGIGFHNKFAEKIFMIFQRLHTQQSTYRGKGMGLAIAQRVMVNHGGFITAKGHPGKGAIFNLYFPASK